jgi:hypothetical protein
MAPLAHVGRKRQTAAVSEVVLEQVKVVGEAEHVKAKNV